ncbi:MAG TPA: hypothetical protein DEA90_04205 [Opitutae bacterium]|nr:hypothetical protein [Puniceicoccaceae bacterium]HBR93349.1 hypothetical protein [Opitutae bacterium]|tara:strand:- start:398 stop:1081 length:684 start_codon:yes stop_codon:yes gene_type:complete
MKIRRRGFTLIELLAVIAVIGILVGILISVIGRSRRAADNVKCASNLRQLASAVLLYTQDHNNQFPASAPTPLAVSIEDYVASGKRGDGTYDPGGVFICPARLDMIGHSKSCLYGVNYYIYGDKHGQSVREPLVRFSQVDEPPRTILMGDCHLYGKSAYKTIQSENLPGISRGGDFGPSGVSVHGNGAANICFMDGHVETFEDVSVLAQAKYRNKGPEDLWSPRKSN